jgi:cytochrome c oxidase cbb3-type subunit IV
MRLARSVLDSITGLEIYAIIGILIFFTLFIIMIVWVIRMKKKKVEEFSRIPLKEDEDDEDAVTDEKKDLDQSKK